MGARRVQRSELRELGGLGLELWELGGLGFRPRLWGAGWQSCSGLYFGRQLLSVWVHAKGCRIQSWYRVSVVEKVWSPEVRLYLA